MPPDPALKAPNVDAPPGALWEIVEALIAPAVTVAADEIVTPPRGVPAPTAPVKDRVPTPAANVRV